MAVHISDSQRFAVHLDDANLLYRHTDGNLYVLPVPALGTFLLAVEDGLPAWVLESSLTGNIGREFVYRYAGGLNRVI